MGFIVEDHDKGIHGELRRESFTIFSDFGTEFSVEFTLDRLDELAFVVQQLQEARDRKR